MAKRLVFPPGANRIAEDGKMRIRIRSPYSLREAKAFVKKHPNVVELSCGCIGQTRCNMEGCCHNGACRNPVSHGTKGYWTIAGLYFCRKHKREWTERGAFYTGVFFVNPDGELDTETSYSGDYMRASRRILSKQEIEEGRRKYWALVRGRARLR